MGIFKSTIGQYKEKKAAFLSYQINQYDQRDFAIWLIVDQQINGFTRLPFSYQYLDESSVRPYPIIRLVAGPGVSVVLQNFPKSYIPEIDKIPLLEIIRVQDPNLVPPLAVDFTSSDFKASTVIGCGMILVGEKCFLIDHLIDHLSNNTRTVQPSNRTRIKHFYSNTELILDVPEFSETPDSPKDSRARFAYEIDLQGSPDSVDKPLIKIVKTPSVDFKIVPNFLPKSPFTADPGLRLEFTIFNLYETDDINDVPPQGWPIIPTDKWRRITSFPREPSMEETIALAAFDTGVGMIPYVGDFVDIAELFYGVFSGKDRWGRKVTTSDLILMGAGALLPFVSSSVLRAPKNLAKVFRGRAEQTAEIIEDLRHANLNSKDAETIRLAEQTIKKGQKLSKELYEDSLKVLQKVQAEPKAIGDLLNAGQTGFTHSELQELYQSYCYSKLKKFEEPEPPHKWAMLQKKGRPRELLVGLFGQNYAQTVKAAKSRRAFNLLDVPCPQDFPEKLVEQHIQTLIKKNSHQVTERLEKALQTETKEFSIFAELRQRVKEKFFNIMKGNLGEIYARKIQQEVLQTIANDNPKVKLISGLRFKVMREGGLARSVQFTDNIIAEEINGHLVIRGVFEVKSGYKGGQEATEQIFDWIEDRIVDGSELVIPAGSKILDPKGVETVVKKTKTFLYQPDSKAPRRVILLMSANRHKITAKGLSHLGADSSMQVAAQVIPHELEITSEQLDYLSAQLLSRLFLVPGG
jgi:hypothetical protein